MFENLFQNVQIFLEHYGLWAVTVCIFFESFGGPVPAESLLITASLMSAEGKIPIVPLFVCAWVAAVAGDNLGYLIGRFGGRQLIEKFGSRMFITPQRLNYVESFFDRYGGIIVIFARFFNFLRQLNGIAAGTSGMGWWAFLLFNMIGAFLWVSVWVAGSYFFGKELHSYHAVLKQAEPFIVVLALGVFFGLIMYGYRRWRAKGKHDEAAAVSELGKTNQK